MSIVSIPKRSIDTLISYDDDERILLGICLDSVTRCCQILRRQMLGFLTRPGILSLPTCGRCARDERYQHLSGRGNPWFFVLVTFPSSFVIRPAIPREDHHQGLLICPPGRLPALRKLPYTLLYVTTVSTSIRHVQLRPFRFLIRFARLVLCGIWRD